MTCRHAGCAPEKRVFYMARTREQQARQKGFGSVEPVIR